MLQNFNKSRIMELEHKEWREWDLSKLSRTMKMARLLGKGNDVYVTKQWHFDDFQTYPCANGMRYINEGMDLIGYPPNALLPCPSEIKLFGADDDSGKMMCEASKLLDVENCKVFSLGSNNQFDFEEAILKHFPKCSVHTYDCTSNPPPNPKPNQHFSKVCLGPRDEMKGDREYQTIATLMKKADTSHIQFLKMDIEGYEMEVSDDVVYVVNTVDAADTMVF